MHAAVSKKASSYFGQCITISHSKPLAQTKGTVLLWDCLMLVKSWLESGQGTMPLLLILPNGTPGSVPQTSILSLPVK